MAAPNVDPNLINSVMCPIRSGTDMLANQEPASTIAGIGMPGKINIQIIPKRAPCMRDCTLFDTKNDQCSAKTLIDSLIGLTSGKGGLGGLAGLFGGLSGP